MSNWENDLFTPTKIQKLNGKYFINDMCHHRIISTNNVENSIENWKPLDYDFSECHTISTDGDIYVIDNTGLNEVIVLDSNLKFKQKFIDIGVRPHCTIFDSVRNSFYVLTANSQEIFCYRKQNGELYQYYSKKLEFFGTAYTRSMTIIDGNMYFACADGHIYVANYSDESYALLNTYNIPNEFGGLNQVIKIGRYYYITAIGDINFNHNPRILRTTDLSTLVNNIYEDLYNLTGFTDQPYFITEFDNRIWITEIGDAIGGIYSFSLNGDNMENIEEIFKFNADEDDFKRKNMYSL